MQISYLPSIEKNQNTKNNILPSNQLLMIKIGLIREGKMPADNRVALTPAQCKWIHKNSDEVRIIAQSSLNRCFIDKEYIHAGVEIREDIRDCDIMLGIKEVPVIDLIANKKYLFFSHTKKMQPHNQNMFREILKKNITLIDYECMEHEDGQRILGFGFFAGVVGAHNGIMAFGKRTKVYHLDRVYIQNSFRKLIHTYFGLRLPNIKVAVTGSGRVAHGVLEVMNLLGIIEVEPDEFLDRNFSYPVFVQLKGNDLYEHHITGKYDRVDFHAHPQNYFCKFLPYTRVTDILMNGIYWDEHMPRLFNWSDLASGDFKIQTIADITDDKGGSIPCNIGDGTMEKPVYGVDRSSQKRTLAYLPDSIDIMAVGNLPNELPRDASRYFGEQLIKYVLGDLIQGNSPIIEKATMVRNGKLTDHFNYMKGYAGI
ncbi:MAG TPA: NAD(P)-dependent oxidoreductase [Puia sp.]|nr:NAD(P)-dependent oxidoreductase [Puia sp.]